MQTKVNVTKVSRTWFKPDNLCDSRHSHHTLRNLLSAINRSTKHHLKGKHFTSGLTFISSAFPASWLSAKGQKLAHSSLAAGRKREGTKETKEKHG